MSNNYSDPDGQSMDDMNELRAKHQREAYLIRQCYRIADDNDTYRPIPTRSHIKVLLERIRQLEQNLLNQVYEP